MSFELTVGDSAAIAPARVTYSLYDLVSTVLHREFDFPQLIRMFTLSENRFDAPELLREAEVLKDVARAHTRPYVDIGTPLDLIDLEGMLNFPGLLPHGAQIVTDWTEIVPFGDEESAIASSPPTLLASRNMLHLVDALAVEVAGASDWAKLPHVSADEFRWEMRQLLADGVPRLDVPPEYLRPWRKHECLKFAEVPLYSAWQDELDSLIDACSEGIRSGKPIVTRT